MDQPTPEWLKKLETSSGNPSIASEARRRRRWFAVLAAGGFVPGAAKMFLRLLLR